MGHHCESKNCGWFSCKNEACDTIIQPSRQRGHRTIPAGGTLNVTDAKTGRQTKTRRQRLVFSPVTRTWVVHPEDVLV